MEISLREFYAGLAMQVYIAEKHGPGDDPPEGSPRFSEEEVAELAFGQADAMMRRRAKIAKEWGDRR